MLLQLILNLYLLNSPNAEASCIRSSPELDDDCGTYGNRTVLAIRVVGPDSETTSSADEIADTIFGSNGKSFTMKSQFAACSYNQFTPI